MLPARQSGKPQQLKAISVLCRKWSCTEVRPSDGHPRLQQDRVHVRQEAGHTMQQRYIHHRLHAAAAAYEWRQAPRLCTSSQLLVDRENAQLLDAQLTARDNILTAPAMLTCRVMSCSCRRCASAKSSARATAAACRCCGLTDVRAYDCIGEGANITRTSGSACVTSSHCRIRSWCSFTKAPA